MSKYLELNSNDHHNRDLRIEWTVFAWKKQNERERIWTMSIGHLLIIDINSDAFKYCQLCEYTALSVWLHQRVIKNELNPLTPITIDLSTTCGGDGDGGRGRPQNRIQTHAHYAEEFKCARIYSQTIDCFFPQPIAI